MTRGKRRSLRPVRERELIPDGRTVRCSCGKRLGLLQPIESAGRYEVDGVWFVPGVIEGAKDLRTGLLMLEHEDWWEVRCPACGRTERGRQRYLRALIEGVDPGGEVIVGDRPRPRRPRLDTSRAW